MMNAIRLLLDTLQFDDQFVSSFPMSRQWPCV